MDDVRVESKAGSPVGKMILGALIVIIGLLLYDKFSSLRSEECEDHVGESVFIGTRTVIDARWTLYDGCMLNVKDTTASVFDHVSPLDAKPNEWETESSWEMSLNIERSAQEKVRSGQ